MSVHQKIALLTIDDAPTEGMRTKVDMLNARGIRAIWFCTGANLEAYAEQAVYSLRCGHLLGNHSYDHPHFSQIGLAEARSQIERTDRLLDRIYAAAGMTRTIKLFRFPYLDDGGEDDSHRAALQRLLDELGYEPLPFKGVTYAWCKQNRMDVQIDVKCTYDTFDWCLEDGQEMFGYRDLPTVLARLDEHVPEGGRGLNEAPGSNEIVMMHAFIPDDAFRSLLDGLLAKPLVFALPIAAQVTIRPVTLADEAVVHPFQTAYLDHVDADEWRSYTAENRGLCFAAYHNGELAGICCGHPSKRRPGEAVLQGIAVNLDERRSYARAGIGSRLLRVFERAAAGQGYAKVGLGAADDGKVEQFYLRSGYRPVELVAMDAAYRELRRAAVESLEFAAAMVQKEMMREALQAAQVIFIFEKSLQPH